MVKIGPKGFFSFSYNPSFSACFFSRNSVFLSQQISRNSIFGLFFQRSERSLFRFGRADKFKRRGTKSACLHNPHLPDPTPDSLPSLNLMPSPRRRCRALPKRTREIAPASPPPAPPVAPMTAGIPARCTPLHLPPPPAPLRDSRFLSRGRPTLSSPDGCRREIFISPHLGGSGGSGSHLGEVRLWHVHQRGDGGSRIKGGVSVACASGPWLLLICSIQLGRRHAYIRAAAAVAVATLSWAVVSLQPPSSSGPGEQAALIGPSFSYTVHASTSTSQPHPLPVLLLVCSTVRTAQLK